MSGLTGSSDPSGSSRRCWCEKIGAGASAEAPPKLAKNAAPATSNNARVRMAAHSSPWVETTLYADYLTGTPGVQREATFLNPLPRLFFSRSSAELVKTRCAPLVHRQEGLDREVCRGHLQRCPEGGDQGEEAD